ncbi:MAG: (deoxy)nucleoside triphosphate pyrophosphohydrolase [Fibrobacterota bacterium]|nr:(deoxy)nucleoside triphosphate pyrophosphohydrolase [Chitinispirillaceae bacterium]
MTEKKFIPVVCAIIEQGDKVLAAKRGSGTTNAGLWEFPGGKVDGGELPADALKREIREELGIEIDCGLRLQSIFYSYPWINIELIPFICTMQSGEPVAHEHEALCFLPSTQLHTLEWAPADLPVIDEYVKTKLQIPG